MSIWVAELDTPHFTFHAFGTGPTNVREVMRQAWERHREQTGATWTWEDVEDGVSVNAVDLGCAYRDWSEI